MSAAPMVITDRVPRSRSSFRRLTQPTPQLVDQLYRVTVSDLIAESQCRARAAAASEEATRALVAQIVKMQVIMRNSRHCRRNAVPTNLPSQGKTPSASDADGALFLDDCTGVVATYIEERGVLH